MNKIKHHNIKTTLKQIFPNMTVKEIEEMEEECRQENLDLFDSMQLQRTFDENLERKL